MQVITKNFIMQWEEDRHTNYSEQSEQSVLGGLLLDNRTWDDIADVINVNDFYAPRHRTIFETVSILIEHNKVADVLTVKEYLNKKNSLTDIGGFDYLTKLINTTPSIANVTTYANHIRDLSLVRALMDACKKIIENAYRLSGAEINEVIDKAETAIFSVAERSLRVQSVANVKDKITYIKKQAEHIAEHGTNYTSTGFNDLDRIISGLPTGDLIIVAGRPSMGKTAFAMNIVEHIAISAKEKKPVAIFSLEMSIDQLIMRLIAAMERIDVGKIKNGKMKDSDWHRFNKAVETLKNADIIIDETPAITPIEIRAKCRRLKRKYPDLAIIMVDYLQLMSVSGNTENRVQEISHISRALKALARELNIPVMALSQLNRAAEGRPKQNKGRMPQMADLRESGAIEQDADIIIFIYRDEVYHDDGYSNPDEIGKADIKIAKNRNGRIANIHLGFQGEFARFVDLANKREEAFISNMDEIYQNDLNDKDNDDAAEFLDDLNNGF